MPDSRTLTPDHTFDTPGPVTVALDLGTGTARITAGKRTVTTVAVTPANAADEHDVRTAEETRVTFENGTLTVKDLRKRSVFGKSGSVAVTVECPAGSHVRGISPMADFVTEGPLGDCELKTSLGDIRVQEAGAVRLKTGHGDISVERADGDAELTGAGRIDVGAVGGRATVKNGNGETVVQEVTGTIRVKSANGRISLGTAHGDVDAKSANGGIQVGEVARGRVALHAATGEVEVGVRESTAAWLDVNTRIGSVRNTLGPTDGPGPDEETVEIHATTGIGDIVIHRP